MKEGKFVAPNQEKWERFESLQGGLNSDPEELSSLYLDITDDLGYAQTYYHRRTIRVYLNQLAQKILIGVNRYQKQSFKNVLLFWTLELPLEIYRSRKTLFIGLISFLIYTLIGWISSHYYPGFMASILGEGYIEMTMQNIENGNPLAVYEHSSQMEMFVTITTNNLMISILLFASGIFLTIGSQFFLMGNGIMLGSFQNMFYQKGLIITSFLGIWIHGSFEISCIILAGGAGITAGSGWMFPGSFTRIQSFKVSFSRGAKIMMSLLPFIIMAGFLESYVTRHYDTISDLSKLFIICFSFSTIVFLYVVLPIVQAHRHPDKINDQIIESPQHRDPLLLLKVRSIGTVFRESFRFFFQFITTIITKELAWIFLIALAMVSFRNYYFPEDLEFVYWFDWSSQLEFIIGYGFHTWFDPFLLIFWILALTHIFLFINYQFLCFGNLLEEKFSAYLKRKYFNTAIALTIFLIPIFLLPWYLILPYLVILPIFGYLVPAVAFPSLAFWKGFKKGLKYGLKGYFFILIGMFASLLLLTILIQPISSVFSIEDSGLPDLLDLLVDLIGAILERSGQNAVFWGNIIRQIIYMLALFLSVSFLMIYTCTMFYSSLEKREAVRLSSELSKFGKRHRIKENNEIDV